MTATARKTQDVDKTLQEVIVDADVERLSNFFWTCAAKTKGNVLIAPEYTKWDDYTPNVETLQRPENDPALSIDEALRWCVVVTDIAECNQHTTGIIHLDRESGNTMIAALRGPAHDHPVAERIIARALQMKPCEPQPKGVSLSLPLPNAPTAANENHRADKPIIAIHQYASKGTPSIPLREFVYGKHQIRKYISALFAAGGIGKSSLLVTETMAMVTGRDILGHKPVRPLRVWLVNAEDPLEEIARKVEATAAHHNVKPDDIGGRLFLSSGRDSDFVIAIETKGVKIQMPVVEAIAEHALRHQIDVIIVDPFVSTHHVNENDNAAVQTVAAAWTALADRLGCAIELAHHVVKGQAEVTEDSGRGAGALKDKARAVRALNRMTPAEAEKWGIDAADRSSYFRSDLGKANLAKSGSGSEWFRFVSVPMGNGVGMQKPQDFTGVVERWFPPRLDPDNLATSRAAERGALVASVSPEKLALIKFRLDNSAFKYSDQATMWAGVEVARILGLDPRADKTQIKGMIDAWIYVGELQKVTLPDHYRRPAPHVKSSCGTTPNQVPQM